MMNVTITRRSQIGFSWTNQAETRYNDDNQSYLTIAEPDSEPSYTGFVSKVLESYRRVAKVNNSNDWRCWWFAKLDGKWVRIDALVYELDMLECKAVNAVSIRTIEQETAEV